MNRSLDVLFVNPSSNAIYQELRSKFSAIEPPTWALLLAQSCRSRGFGAAILDIDAENISSTQAVEKIKEINPRLVCFAVYGSEPNQGTTRMSGAVPLCGLLKQTYPQYFTCFAGSHTQALPLEVLALPSVDFVLLNEGVYALTNLLKTDLEQVSNVKGIGYKTKEKELVLNHPERIVPQDLLNEDLPGYAWDLVDFNKYRSHFWHAKYKHEERTPFAALYTSLGCFAKCSFCMVNLINRIDNSEGITAADNAVFRYWHPGTTIKQIDELVNRGVRNIRFSDEMFFLKRQHFEPLLTMIRDRYGDSLNLWCYARVDTCRPGDLALFRSAGMRWICLGIESGNQVIRQEISKGSYKEVNIRSVVKAVEDSDIDVIANYIVGLPCDTQETMKETLDLGIELNTRMFNMYPGMALPGSPLYQQAKQAGLQKTMSVQGLSEKEAKDMEKVNEKLEEINVKIEAIREAMNVQDVVVKSYYESD